MNKAVLAIALASYGTAFVAPNPGLKRTALDRVEPKQSAKGTGFWGAGAELRVLGPSLEQLYGRVPIGVPDGFTTTIDTLGVLRDEHPRIYTEIAGEYRRGFIRMVPSMWYGVKDREGRIVGDGRSAGSGRYFWYPAQRPTIPKEWKIVDERVSPIRLEVSYPNAGALGGGIGTQIIEPRRWKLSQIGLSPNDTYVVSWRDAWENVLSTKTHRHLATDDQATYEMFPEVWAEVRTTTLIDRVTGEQHVIETPTGWVEAAGRFVRRLGSE